MKNERLPVHFICGESWVFQVVVLRTHTTTTVVHVCYDDVSWQKPSSRKICNISAFYVVSHGKMYNKRYIRWHHLFRNKKYEPKTKTQGTRTLDTKRIFLYGNFLYWDFLYVCGSVWNVTCVWSVCMCSCSGMPVHAKFPLNAAIYTITASMPSTQARRLKHWAWKIYLPFATCIPLLPME